MVLCSFADTDCFISTNTAKRHPAPNKTAPATYRVLQTCMSSTSTYTCVSLHTWTPHGNKFTSEQLRAQLSCSSPSQEGAFPHYPKVISQRKLSVTLLLLQHNPKASIHSVMQTKGECKLCGVKQCLACFLSHMFPSLAGNRGTKSAGKTTSIDFGKVVIWICHFLNHSRSP